MAARTTTKAEKAPKSATAKKAPRKPAARKRAAAEPAPRKPAAGKRAAAEPAPRKPTAGKRAAAEPAPRKPAASSASRSPEPPGKATAPAAPLQQSNAPVPDRQWPNAPVRRGLGVALLGLAGADRFASGHSQVVPGAGGGLPAEPLVDVVLGVLDLALEVAETASAAATTRMDPLLSRAWAPASGPVGGVAGTGLRLLGALTEPLARRGRRLRSDSELEAEASVAAILPETIRMVMEQLDLTDLAVEHVDVQRVLEATADQVDLTQFAIDNMDLQRMIEASLDAVDFTGMAIDRMDFARAMTAALQQVDVLNIARDQLDPARVAAYLRDNVDLGDTIRSAPGAVAGEAVRGVRETVGRIAGRR